MLFKVRIKYNVPKEINGWKIEEDTFIFSTEQERTDFLNGQVVYDYLDYMVQLDTTKYTVIKVYEENTL